MKKNSKNLVDEGFRVSLVETAFLMVILKYLILRHLTK